MTVVRFSTILAVAAIAITQSPSAGAKSWTIDTAASKVEVTTFRGPRMSSQGSINGVTGSIVSDGKNFQASSVSATIPVGTFDTGVPVRDGDVKGAKYLDVKRFPVATFKSTRLRPAKNGNFLMNGEFKLHGVSKVIEMSLDKPVVTLKRGKPAVLTAIATTVINQNDYALNFKLLHPNPVIFINDQIFIKVRLKAVSL